MGKINPKQREALSQFYSNFALAWYSLGIISPIFNEGYNLTNLIKGIILGLIMGSVFLVASLKVLEAKNK